MTQSHIKEIYTEHRGRTEGRREQRGDEFGFLSDLRGAEEFRDGWIPGIPEFISQFQRK